MLTGALRQRQGELAIAELERRRIPVLEEIARLAQAQAEALGDPDAVARVAKLREEIEGLRATSDLAAREAARLKDALESDVEGGIAAFFRDPTAPLQALQQLIDSLRSTLADFLAQKVGDQLFGRGTDATVTAAAALAAAGASLGVAAAPLTLAGGSLTAAAPALAGFGGRARCLWCDAPQRRGGADGGGRRPRGRSVPSVSRSRVAARFPASGAATPSRPG